MTTRGQRYEGVAELATGWRPAVRAKTTRKRNVGPAVESCQRHMLCFRS